MNKAVHKIQSVFLIILVSFFLFSCAFENIYKKNNINSKPECIPAIEIIEGKVSIKDKKLYRVFYDKLNEEFYTDSENLEYLLYLSLSESVGSAATTSSGSVGRYKYTLIVNYRLVDAKTEVEVGSGVVKSISSYESSNSRFTTYSANLDTLNKLAVSVIEKLKLKITTNIYSNSQL